MQLSLQAEHITAANAMMVATDDCASATDLSSLLGGAVDTPVSSAMFTNVGATTDATDPTMGWECFGEPDGSGTGPTLENTQWVTFTGDGETYAIQTTDCGGTVTDYVDDGDTQIAIYSGADCDNLTPVACNEDLPGAPTGGPYPAGLDFVTEVGVKYYMMIDGFGGADGEYCIQFTLIQPNVVPCTDIAIGVSGTTKPVVCMGDTTSFSLEDGTVIPSVIGAVNGFRWSVNSADVSGSTNPFMEASYQGAFGEVIDPANIYTPLFVNNGAQLPAGVYFFTPVVYGGGVGTGNINTIDFTNGCVATGNSIQVELLGATAAITATTSAVDVTGAGNNGEASVTAAGGTGNYTYFWNANGETTATITGLPAGTYSCTIGDAAGCAGDLIVEVEVKDLTAIDELAFAQAISLFPNPAIQKAAVQFDFSEKVDLTISITNTVGQEVYRSELNNTKNGIAELDVSNFASGVYFVKLSEGQNQMTKRLIVKK